MRKMNKVPFLNLFMPKRKSRGTMWASLLGLGISAAVLGVKRGKRRSITSPIQNAVRNFTPQTNINLMDNAALTEFSEELLTNALNNNKE
ncbi:hypothetical protein AA0X95_13670 [Bacillus sp. 1P10SD]|uniref:hypothetical protein n=1 Tax=Bacillus sp. 1P10SD TaxID=3132265 RepID=UPI0039A50BC2